MPRASKLPESEPVLVRLRDAAVWRAIRKPFRLRLLEVARARQGVTAQSLAARVGISSQLMLYHLQLLEKAGLVRHQGGRRARGQGGRFHATHGALQLMVDPKNAGEMRRLDKVLQAMEHEAREGRDPRHPGRTGTRWECLTPAEAREIERCMARVDAVMEGAARRRRSADAAPDATHVVSLSLRRARPGFLPAGECMIQPPGKARR